MSACYVCNADLAPGQRFCSECGAAAKAAAPACRECGAEQRPGARFCPACGAPYAPGTHAPGTTLQGRYVVQQLLDAGGRGAIYLAQHATLGQRRVIVKAIPLSHPQHASEIQSEAEVVGKMSHAGLVTVYDFFTERDHAHVVMEYVDGENLGRLLVREPDFLAYRRISGWMHGLCDLLQYLHTRQPPAYLGMLPLSSVMVDRGGTARLVRHGLQRGGTVHGDLAALGGLFYVLLTRRPHQAGAPHPSSLSPNASPYLDEVFARLMASGFASALDVARALERYDRMGEAAGRQ